MNLFQNQHYLLDKKEKMKQKDENQFLDKLLSKKFLDIYLKKKSQINI